MSGSLNVVGSWNAIMKYVAAKTSRNNGTVVARAWVARMPGNLARTIARTSQYIVVTSTRRQRTSATTNDDGEGRSSGSR
ncbi:hypothetical protein D3C74_454590 [compost metagenome]